MHGLADHHGRLPRVVLRACAVAIVTIMAGALLAPAPAEGAVISSRGWRVQPKGTVTSPLPIIVNGGGSFDAYPLDAATITLTVDGQVVPRGEYVATTPFTRNLYLYWSPSPALSDGAHTVSVSVSDTNGRVSSCQWDFTMALPPGAAWIAPASGEALRRGTPEVMLEVTDNADAGITVAGEVRAGSADGPVAATFGGSGLAPGSLLFTPVDALLPGDYVLTATVADAGGLARTLAGAEGRPFSVVAPPAMTIAPDTCTDAGCHVVTGHPGAGMPCEDCHVVVPHEYAQCDDCHAAHGPTMTVTGIFGPCTACHDPSHPDVLQHTPAGEAARHASGCDGCHDEDLIARHAVTPSGSAFAYQCDLCHASADPRVAAAVAAGDAGCGACHDAEPGHGFDPALHEASIDGDGLTGSWTYVETDKLVNSVPMNVPYAYADVVCLGCHDAQIAGPDGEHSKSGATSAAAGCAACHPAPRDTFASWDGTCYACHEQAQVHVTADLSTRHSLAGDVAASGSCGFTNPLNGRRPCHYVDIVQEHNRLISPEATLPNTVLSVTCEECHSSPVTIAALADGWDGTCTDCHDGTALPNHTVVGSDRYDEVYAIHDNPSGFYDAGYTSNSGLQVAGYNAMDAHGPVRVNPLGGANKTIGCGAPTCHTGAYLGGGWPYSAGPACGECHGPNVAPVQPYQGDYAWYSDSWTDGEALDTKLVMTLDPILLPAASTLDFMTFYDIEEGWDYGYVEVSTDGGASWTSLPSSITTNTNPYGANLGNGITGATSGAWVPASFDLAAYAGQVVRIRFSYQADYYVYGQGWMLDVITVGPAGAPVFSDDVETLDPAWTVELDPLTSAGWQRYTP